MKRLIFFAAAALLLLAPQIFGATADKLSALSNVQVTTARMPFYKDNKLEFFLVSHKVTMQGALLNAQWPVIDIIKDGVPVETIGKIPIATGMEQIYRLHTGVEEIAKYWEKRSYSEGIITSESAEVDQTRKVATGHEKVFFRSPTLDLNGVGFTADFNSRIVTVHSEVEISLRNNGSSALGSSMLVTSRPQPPKDDKPQADDKDKVNVTRAFCDVLTLDINRNLIILTGNVRVFDESGSITADTLEIEMDDAKGREKKNDDAGVSRAENSMGDLKEVRFFGSVHAIRNLTKEEAADGEQQATADILRYQVKEDLLTLMGTLKQQPVISRGTEFARANRIELRPHARRIEFFEHCKFEFVREIEKGKKADKPTVITTRHAVFDDAAKKINLVGEVKLFDPAENADLASDTVELQLPADGSTRPESIIAVGNVDLKRISEGVLQHATGGKFTYREAEQTILMEQNPVLSRGTDSISGQTMCYYMNLERMVVQKNTHIVITDTGAAAGDALAQVKDPGKMELYSEDADLNYGGNQLLFTKNVKITGRGALLNTEQLDIALAEVLSAKGKKEKMPTRALATGKVHAEDDSGMLDTELLDVRFLNAPGKQTEVSHIYADRGVKIQSRPDPEAATDATLLGKSGTGSTSLTAQRGEIDLLRNIADFYEQVKVYDDQATLDCEHLHVIAKAANGVVPAMDTYKARDEFPSRLAIGSDRELESITAIDKVVITRTRPNAPKEFAKGDRAFYEVAKRTVELTANAPNKPFAVTNQGGMTGEKVVIDLDTQDVMVEQGDVLAHTEELEPGNGK